MIAGLLFAAVFIAIVFPETPAGKSVARILFAAHQKLFRHVTTTRIVLAILVIFAVIAVVKLIGPEGAALIGTALPEAIAWFITFDIATYFEALAIVWALAALGRLRVLSAMIGSVRRRARRTTARALARIRRTARQRTRHTPGIARSKPANDDEPAGWRHGFAMTGRAAA